MAMETCDEHDNCIVVYTSRYCPLCLAEEKVDELSDERDQLQDKINEMKEGD